MQAVASGIDNHPGPTMRSILEATSASKIAQVTGLHLTNGGFGDLLSRLVHALVDPRLDKLYLLVGEWLALAFQWHGVVFGGLALAFGGLLAISVWSSSEAEFIRRERDELTRLE